MDNQLTVKQEKYTNFVTPPDTVTDKQHTVLLMDVSEEHVQQIAHWCKQARDTYNIYLYHAGMSDPEWFKYMMLNTDAMIINTEDSDLSGLKDRAAESSRSWYYGPRNFLTNAQRIQTPLEYFLSLENSVK